MNLRASPPGFIQVVLMLVCKTGVGWDFDLVPLSQPSFQAWFLMVDASRELHYTFHARSQTYELSPEHVYLRKAGRTAYSCTTEHLNVCSCLGELVNRRSKTLRPPQYPNLTFSYTPFAGACVGVCVATTPPAHPSTYSAWVHLPLPNLRHTLPNLCHPLPQLGTYHSLPQQPATGPRCQVWCSQSRMVQHPPGPPAAPPGRLQQPPLQQL